MRRVSLGLGMIGLASLVAPVTRSRPDDHDHRAAPKQAPRPFVPTPGGGARERERRLRRVRKPQAK
jgi:hypothetical protein